jgi:hypothetical protein
MVLNLTAGASWAPASYCALTFDVRGGPLAGRPLDGGVRRGVHWVAPEMPRLQKVLPLQLTRLTRAVQY